MGGRVPASVPPTPRDRPIAVSDSGVGGLTVLHELLVSLPHEDFLYLGTRPASRTAALPRNSEPFSLQVAEELLRHRAKLLVVACNSATAAALPALQERMMQATLGVDVIGVVKPEALQAVAATRTGRIGLLATPATVASGAYERAVAQADAHTELVSVPCPDLAPIIQTGFPFDDALVEIVRGCCAPCADQELQKWYDNCVMLLWCWSVVVEGRELRELAEELGIATCCRFLGHVAAATTPVFYHFTKHRFGTQ